MTLRFDARLDGPLIHCAIGTDTDLHAPVFCFAIQAPAAVELGGTIIRSVGGYTEIQLPDIAAGGTHQLTLRYADPYFKPANRAWLPLGGYLRVAGECLPLPVLPAGVIAPIAASYPPCDGLRLVPPPQDWQPAEGTVPVESFACDDPALASVNELAHRLNLPAFLAPQGQSITVQNDPSLPPEGYRLQISNQITLSSATPAGTFYGGITLLNLRETYDGALPCGTITDHPRFEWRGQHLDCARHFFHPETITRLMDLMALLKLNRFHWHFADDEAFRLQTDTAPELWQQTEWRGEGFAIPGVFGGGIKSGGSYSKDDARAIVAHGQALHIDVLPEIEVPAHALCLNTVLAGLRDPDDTSQEVSVQGYIANAVNPAMPATWELLKPLAREVASLFPLGILHLGGDELAPGTWDGSPGADALKRREGLSSRDDLQGWTMAHLAADLSKAGIRPAAWEEASRGCQGGIGHGALVFSWTGQTVGIEAARMGHQVVMCPAQHVYFDMAHTDQPWDWGANWAAYVALEDVVNWSPIPAEAPDIANNVIGIEGTFWCEFTCNDVELEPMLAPRILGLASKAWEADGTTDGARLRKLTGAYAPVFDRIGWQRHKGA